MAVRGLVAGNGAMAWKISFRLLVTTLVLGLAEPFKLEHTSASNVFFLGARNSNHVNSALVHPWRVARVLLQAPEQGVTQVPFILAGNRTDRPNPLDSFHKYRGGWDIRSKDYWASVGYTGAPGFIVAALWLALGVLLTLLLCCCCCCCRGRLKSEYNNGACGYILPLLLLVFFTAAAVVGCAGLYYGQQKWNNQLDNTLDYVVNQSETTVAGLRNTSSFLTSASNINVSGFGLSASDKQSILSLQRELNSSTNTLQEKTDDNHSKISNVIHDVRIALIVVAGVMLGLVLLGLLFSACGFHGLVSFLIFVGWILVIATWILCGIFILLNNVIGDTCVAMDEWGQNPSANTTLDEILPCVDPGTATNALTESKDLTTSIIEAVNKGLLVANANFPAGAEGATGNYNQSGPLVPTLCPLYGPSPDYTPLPCPIGEVNFTSAPGVWSSYICESNANGLCTSQGRLTRSIYSELTTAVSIGDGLYDNTAFLLDVADCSFVRRTFITIVNVRCHDLRKYSKWIWVGLILVSGGSSLSILLWILLNRRRGYRYGRKANDTKGDYANGHAGHATA